MDKYPYESRRIKHIAGQEGPIHEIGKALVMATIEDEQRNLADAYDVYCSAPDAFEGALPAEMHEEFSTWHKKGISSDYIRRIGEQMAEQAGAIVDYLKELKEEKKSPDEVKRDIRNNILPFIFQNVMAAVHKDWNTESEVAQNPDYQYRVTKSAIHAGVITTALEALRKKKSSAARRARRKEQAV